MALSRQERPPLRIKTILGVHSRCSRVTPRCQCLRGGFLTYIVWSTEDPTLLCFIVSGNHIMDESERPYFFSIATHENSGKELLPHPPSLREKCVINSDRFFQFDVLSGRLVR
ncbi:hypothetical protein CDAR_122601 [Caerostris darwini]|uniref:Uncharacterized protein n=1 Tax=Caerostris darwini TaxID=1538125 RepID=A0AAV4M9U7_9ARAC|nr:hypothetical protein CDAR_122601 [Caerostris darwini]